MKQNNTWFYPKSINKIDCPDSQIIFWKPAHLFNKKKNKKYKVYIVLLSLKVILSPTRSTNIWNVNSKIRLDFENGERTLKCKTIARARIQRFSALVPYRALSRILQNDNVASRPYLQNLFCLFQLIVICEPGTFQKSAGSVDTSNNMNSSEE